MNLLEYEAKDILRRYKVPTPDSQLIIRDTKPDISFPTVLKSQVPIGGRGKLGGIRVVESSEDLPDAVDQLFALDIKGFLPSVLLAEEKLDIAREFYLSVLIDRSSSQIQLVAHPEGGVEIENNVEGGIWKVAIGGVASDEVIGEQLAELFDIPEQTFVLQDMVKNLYDCFVKNDATLLEINPLILTTSGKLVAGDCKMTLDAGAAFRHLDWSFEAEQTETNFVTLNPEGEVATIANGAGLAMATVDAVADYGMSPANFLDIGGGANSESVLAAFRRIMEYSHVKVIVINIFAGITRCDEVAKAIIEAREQITDLPPLCIRLAGTNYEAAAELLEAEGIATMPTLEDCLSAAKEIAT